MQRNFLNIHCATAIILKNGNQTLKKKPTWPNVEHKSDKGIKLLIHLCTADEYYAGENCSLTTLLSKVSCRYLGQHLPSLSFLSHPNIASF